MTTSIRALAALFVVLASAGSVAAQTQDRQEKPEKPKLQVKLNERLKFMAGCWEGRLDRQTIVEEIWTNPTENLMTSTTRYITDDRATSHEFSRITSRDSTVTFEASTEGKPFDEYTMVQLVDEYVVFENLKKSFPQRISYRLASDGSLLPRNEGEGQTSVEVRFRKVKCPGT